MTFHPLINLITPFRIYKWSWGEGGAHADSATDRLPLLESEPLPIDRFISFPVLAESWRLSQAGRVLLSYTE